jgi:hypothetical protein
MADESKIDDNIRENENSSIRIESESEDDQCYDMSDCGECYSDPCCETFCCCCC